MSTRVLNNPNKETELQPDHSLTEDQATPASPVSKKLPAIKKGSELRVLLFVMSLFVVLEVGFWVGRESLSKDITHLRAFQAIAGKLADFDSNQGVRLLFLGNSLTRYGVDQEVFAEVIEEETGVPVQSVKINPDNTALADWFYAYRTYFEKARIAPDVVIIGFEGSHLRDAPSSHPNRLAQYYCSWSDYSELSQYELKTFEDQANFTLCKLSVAFGNRDRVERRVLNLLIPNYQAGTEQLNRRRNDYKRAVPSAPSYKRLEKLISIAQEQGTKIILAAMPVPEAYDFDPELLKLVEKTSAVLVDCRTVEGITLPMFFDGLHMDEQAAELYSTAVARRAGPVLLSLVAGHE